MKKLIFLFTFLLVASLRSYAAPVDVNTADADMLAESLNGIGPKIAAAIVEYRKQNGPFQSIDELLNVKGIGSKMLERNQKDIILRSENQPQR
jgi:competence protein ComEA